MYKELRDLEIVDLGTLYLRRHYNDPTLKETRGLKKLLLKRDIQRLEQII
jgi:hypothetical protein